MTIRIRQETKENHGLFSREAEKSHLKYQFLAAGKWPVTLAIKKLTGQKKGADLHTKANRSK